MEFKPGGLNIMFVGLTRDSNVGDIFALTLICERAGELSPN
ncbi:MAG: copper chaperone PCu(A)C [Chloroflexi bacterium]|nr:copper chaperone PCu(A)C [Chloroflexota bacterium]